MNVAIVGLGSAGQSASIFLKQLGHQVKVRLFTLTISNRYQVFERVAIPQPIGAGFLVRQKS